MTPVLTVAGTEPRNVTMGSPKAAPPDRQHEKTSVIRKVRGPGNRMQHPTASDVPLSTRQRPENYPLTVIAAP